MAVCKHIKIIHFWFSALLWLCWLCCKPALDSVSQTKTEKGNEEQAIIACACPFRTLQYKWSWSLQQNWKYPGEIHMPDSPQVRHSLLAKSIRNLLCITILLEYPAVPTSICMCPTLSCYLSLKCTAKMHRWRMHFSPCQDGSRYTCPRDRNNSSDCTAEAGPEGRALGWLSHMLPLNTPHSGTKTFTRRQGTVCMKHKIVHQ